MNKKDKPLFVRFVLSVLIFVVTLVVLFEEWLWFRLLAVMQQIVKLPVFKQIENWIRNQNRWISLALFVIPELSFIPVKLSVVWLFGNHHPYLGVIVFLCAKLLGTALFAWMYAITEPQITKFAFVRWFRDKFLFVRKWAHDWIHTQPLYHTIRERVLEIKARFRARREHWLKRRFRAARVVVRREQTRKEK